MSRYYAYKYKLAIPPYDKVIEVLEAFFSSYPEGDYTCEQRSKFKLEFRRGAWKRGMLGFGERVPEKLVPGQFNKWPLMVKVMVRPSPTAFDIAVHYELHLPKSVNALSQDVQSAVDLHARRELEQLAVYLAECVGIKDTPAVAPL